MWRYSFTLVRVPGKVTVTTRSFSGQYAYTHLDQHKTVAYRIFLEETSSSLDKAERLSSNTFAGPLHLFLVLIGILPIPDQYGHAMMVMASIFSSIEHSNQASRGQTLQPALPRRVNVFGNVQETNFHRFVVETGGLH